jgi:hypothetical protein
MIEAKGNTQSTKIIREESTKRIVHERHEKHEKASNMSISTIFFRVFRGQIAFSLLESQS